MEIHAFESGRLSANGTFLRGEGFSSLLRRREDIEFPALSFVVEHPDGLIAIDTGLAAGITAPRRLRGFPPAPARPVTEVADQMAERGLDPADVRLVVLTHLDWDHAGGLQRFPRAQVLVHRPEWEFARTRPGRWRYRPGLWPEGFAPSAYDLEDTRFGPFPASREVADGVRVLPIPGHSPGQVAVAVEDAGPLLLFAADHALRADWFTQDAAAGRELMMGAFAPREARETTRRLSALVAERPTVLLPSHDTETPARLAARAPVMAAAG